MDMPNELILNVLNYLKFKDLLKVAQTCTRLNELSCNNILWKKICEEEGFNALSLNYKVRISCI